MCDSVQPLRLASSRKERAAAALAAAFHHDPMYRCVIPEEKKRPDALGFLFKKVIAYTLEYGEACVTPGPEGAACWLRPGQADLSWRGIFRTGLFLLPFYLGWRAYRRLDANLSFAEKMHRQYAPEPHYNLWVIGVAPSGRGRGLGGSLIRPVLESAEGTGVPCYLETHNEKNIRFYERQGFKVVHQGEEPKHGLKVWALKREARAPQASLPK